MHHPYVWDEAIDALQQTPRALERLLELIPMDRWEVRPSPERYSPKELVYHLLDVEQAFYRRYQQMTEEDHPLLSVYDPEGEPLADRFAMQSLHDAVEQFARARERSLDYLRHLPEDARDRVGTHPEFGEWSIFQQVQVCVAHDLTHLCDILTRTK